MNLVVDIGNTRTKAALYSGNSLIEFHTLKNPKELFKSGLIEKCSKIIISSVTETDDFFIELLKLKETILFTTQTQIPITNDYKSISTLGSDRLLASIGAYFSYPKSNVLVIDAGTCIKYNFTNSDNHYLGGGISPGITMKLKSLHDYTAKLPLIEFDENFNLLIGDSTQHSILSGVLNGTIAEIDGIINTYKLHYPDLICLLTGGDSEYLANRLKNSIFTHQNLVLKGLNDILNYTIEINSNK